MGHPRLNRAAESPLPPVPKYRRPGYFRFIVCLVTIRGKYRKCVDQFEIDVWQGAISIRRFEYFHRLSLVNGGEKEKNRRESDFF
jgi:hypothetical protein